MCGFFGVFDIKGVEEGDITEIDKGLKSTNYRGPDDKGFFKSEKYYVGFNRLSIVDIGAKSQPLISEDKNIILVCNGEIYNFLDLKKQLSNKYKFKSNMDTEVLLHGYHEWGDKLWDKARGMFSVAIFNKRENKLKLIRDHAGIKPLHYLQVNKKIYFSNDIKCFLSHKNINLNIRNDSIISYLSFRYVLGENTFYKEIKDVLPAEILIFDGEIYKKNFWKLSTSTNFNLSEKKAVEILDEKLSLAVKTHLIGDVKKGVFVSGGLDSSLIAHYMKKYQQNIEGFATIFKNNNYSEYDYMKLFCDEEKIKLNIINLDKKLFIKNIDNIIQYRSEPTSIPHETGFFLMAKEMSQKIKVVLSGEGADELFGGYGRIFQSPIDYYKKKLFNRNLSEVDHFIDRYSIFKKKDKNNFLNLNAFSNRIHDNDSIQYLNKIFKEVDKKNYFEKMYHVMFKIHLPNMLNRLDRMTMSNSIEARVPFVDRDLIDFIFSLPTNFKIKWKSNFHKYMSLLSNSDQISEKNDIPKYILKKTAENKINKKLIYRKKIAFPLPINNWMENELGDYTKDILLSKKAIINDYINKDYVEKKLSSKNFKSNEELEGKKIWMLLNLEKWLQNNKLFN